MKRFFDCSIGDAEVEVEANCKNGSLGNFFEPPEGPEINITNVVYNGKSITNRLRDEWFEKLITQAAEQYDDFDRD